MASNDDIDKPFLQTDYLLPDSIIESAAPDKTVEETKEDATPLLESSVVDVQRDRHFALTVDPSLILVKNMATGGTDFNLFTLGDISEDYF